MAGLQNTNWGSYRLQKELNQDKKGVHNPLERVFPRKLTDPLSGLNQNGESSPKGKLGRRIMSRCWENEPDI